MSIDTAALITAIRDALESGTYPCGLTEWIASWERRNYKKPGDAVAPILAHLESLGPSASPLDVFLPWTDSQNVYWGAQLLITAAFLKQRGLAGAEHRHEPGGLHITAPTLVAGDLRVGGDLEITATQERVDLLVLGDLEIGGDFKVDWCKVIVMGDVRIGGAFVETSEWSVVVGCGDLSAHRNVVSCGEFAVFGRTTSPMISATYNHGYCTLLGGASALLFREHDHAGSYAKSVDADVRVIHELGVDEQTAQEAFAGLFRIVRPKWLEELPNPTDYDPETHESFDEFIMEEAEDYWADVVGELTYELEQALARGEEVFVPEVLATWRGKA